MKVKHYLETITGIEVFPLISLVIFTVFFAVILWYVIKMDKDRVTKVSHMPLDSENTAPIKPFDPGCSLNS